MTRMEPRRPVPRRSAARRATSADRAGTRRGASRRGGRGLPAWQRWIPGLLVVAGILVLLYPVVATQYNNARQREFSAQYKTQVSAANAADLQQDLARAQEYNRGLQGIPILDPWLVKAARDPRSDAYVAYTNQLSRFPALARVRVPTGDIDLPVYHDTSDAVLAKGAGHLYGTSLPVGGVGTHAVLTSHTGMSNATLFDHLNRVREGDLMYVDVAGQTLAYRVDQIAVVLPTEVGGLTAVDGHDYLTLFTCTPYAVNTHRLLVRGERVQLPATKKGPDAAPPIAWEPWMTWLVGAAVAGLAVVAVVAFRERRRGAVRGVPSGRRGYEGAPTASGAERHDLPRRGSAEGS